MGHYARRQTLPLPFSYFDRPKYDCTRKLKKLGRYSNCSSTMSCYRSEKSHFVLLVTCYSCWHFTCRLRVILLFLFQFFGVLFFQANCSSSIVVIVIFSVGWPEVAYMFRCSVPALKIVISWRTVRCLTALPLFAAHSNITSRSRFFKLSHWLKMTHPWKGVKWCCLRYYRIIRLITSVVIRRSLHNSFYALIHGIGEILCIL